MFNKKEKQIKKVLLSDDVDFTLEDKEDILINIKSKLNLESQKEKSSLRRSFNLKVVYGLVCSLVICVIGYVGYLLFIFNQRIECEDVVCVPLNKIAVINIYVSDYYPTPFILILLSL